MSVVQQRENIRKHSPGRLALQMVILALTLEPMTAAAQSAGTAECRNNPHLARARELYDGLQFDECAATLQRAIEYSNNCKYDLAEIYKLKAFVDAVNGERERCHRDFEIFLALNPDYKMPKEIPPKIRSCFEDAERVAPSRRSLSIRHEAPKEVQPNAPVSIRIEVTDPLRLVDQVTVFYRPEGMKVFTPVSARADDTVSIVIPALALPAKEEGYQMEYFVRAVDRWEGVLAEDGDNKKTLRFMVLPGDKGPTDEWWFWAAVSAGAVGVGAFVFLITRPDADQIDLTLRVNDNSGDSGSGG